MLFKLVLTFIAAAHCLPKGYKKNMETAERLHALEKKLDALKPTVAVRLARKKVVARIEGLVADGRDADADAIAALLRPLEGVCTASSARRTGVLVNLIPYNDIGGGDARSAAIAGPFHGSYSCGGGSYLSMEGGPLDATTLCPLCQCAHGTSCIGNDCDACGGVVSRSADAACVPSSWAAAYSSSSRPTAPPHMASHGGDVISTRPLRSDDDDDDGNDDDYGDDDGCNGDGEWVVER